MKSFSLMLLIIVVLSSWTICCAELEIRTEVYEGVISENELLAEMRQILPSEMFISDACSVGERTYILSTPYEALSDTGPYSLYRISNVSQFTCEILRDLQRRWMAKCAGRNRCC